MKEITDTERLDFLIENQIAVKSTIYGCFFLANGKLHGGDMPREAIDAAIDAAIKSQKEQL